MTATITAILNYSSTAPINPPLPFQTGIDFFGSTEPCLSITRFIEKGTAGLLASGFGTFFFAEKKKVHPLAFKLTYLT